MTRASIGTRFVVPFLQFPAMLIKLFNLFGDLLRNAAHVSGCGFHESANAVKSHLLHLARFLEQGFQALRCSRRACTGSTVVACRPTRPLRVAGAGFATRADFFLLPRAFALPAMGLLNNQRGTRYAFESALSS